MNDIVARLLSTLAAEGAVRYGSEPVSVLEHSLQCALLAAQDGASPALIAAAMLHDYGHVMHDDEKAAAHGRDMRHEEMAADHLARWFGPDVIEPIRLHVPAKRYLCAVEPGYFESLSAGSVESLRVQGSTFSAEEADRFIRRPLAAEAVRLRRWDDGAKISGLETPDVASFGRFVSMSLRLNAA